MDKTARDCSDYRKSVAHPTTAQTREILFILYSSPDSETNYPRCSLSHDSIMQSKENYLSWKDHGHLFRPSMKPRPSAAYDLREGITKCLLTRVRIGRKNED